MRLPIEERKAKLAGLLRKPPPGVLFSSSFTEKIGELLERARALSLEGLIAKQRSGSRYDSKRTGAWIKIKLYQQQAFVIGGYTQPEGERKYFGALLVGVYEDGKLKFAGRVGTGFSEKLLRSLSDDLAGITGQNMPFLQPARTRPRSRSGIERCCNEAVPLGRSGSRLPGQIHGVDT